MDTIPIITVTSITLITISIILWCIFRSGPFSEIAHIISILIMIVFGLYIILLLVQNRNCFQSLINMFEN